MLLATMTFEYIEKCKGKLNLRAIYFHRYLRIVPLYSFVLAVMYWVVPAVLPEKIGDEVDLGLIDCRSYWWTNLVFLNNFIPYGKGNNCFGVSWYLAVDMQLYLVAPLIVYIYYKHDKRVTWGVLGLLVLLGVLINSYFAVYYDLSANQLSAKNEYSGGNRYFDEIYTKPYCRFIPYLIGMCCGFVYLHSKGKVKDPIAKTILGTVKQAPVNLFLLGQGLILFILYIQLLIYSNFNSDALPPIGNYIFIALSKLLSSLGLSAVFLPVLSDQLPLVSACFSSRIFTPLSKLIYACYLIHPVILEALTTTYNDSITPFLTDLVLVFPLSIISAGILHLLIELPVRRLFTQLK